MEYTTLGSTGVKVSRLCFGTMSFGGDADEATSGAMFKQCRDAGINFFDTANVYSRGKSEEILGRLMKGQRDDLVLTTKVAGRMGDGPNDAGLSRRAIKFQLEASLKRLGTDRVEFYFCHVFDADTPACVLEIHQRHLRLKFLHQFQRNVACGCNRGFHAVLLQDIVEHLA